MRLDEACGQHEMDLSLEIHSRQSRYRQDLKPLRYNPFAAFHAPSESPDYGGGAAAGAAESAACMADDVAGSDQ